MDELQISGKRFISSRRIARDNGYTSDYIGQLIRAQKIIGQKVGRAWYVDAISFDAFLGVEGQVRQEQPVQPVQDVQQDLPALQPIVKEVVIEEKKEEEQQYVPLHIEKVEKKEVPVGLRYYADESPSLPNIQTEVQSDIKKYYVENTSHFSAQPTNFSHKFFTVGLAAIGIAVFIFSAFLSSSVSLDLNIEEGNAASVSYSINW